MKIYPKDEKEIIKLTKEGYTQQAIADHFGVVRSLISMIQTKHGVKRGKRVIGVSQ